MKHIADENIRQEYPCAVTLGNFDGLHVGHRTLIQTMKGYAAKENLTSVVFSFTPHPMFVLRKKEEAALVVSPDEKKYIIEKTGVDLYIEYPFTLDFAATTPEKFIKELLHESLRCKVLVIGENYKFGKGASGNTDMLKKLGADYGIEVVTVPAVTYESERVSSTRIRERLVHKDLEKVAAMMTQPYFIIGTVIEGKKVGRTLGFPTVNIIAHPLKLLPPNGVYATKTICNGKVYEGITNVGFNPTVSGTKKTVETNLFDFEQFVYGETIQTQFFQWIRDEEKFPSVEALKSQIEKDVLKAKELFRQGFPHDR